MGLGSEIEKAIVAEKGNATEIEIESERENVVGRERTDGFGFANEGRHYSFSVSFAPHPFLRWCSASRGQEHRQ